VQDVDHSEQAVVISVVYDGPPEAGKTTTVRALARGFGREVYTPEERDGRTVHFDWLEHIGGRFEGSPIRCQIVSVPGQKRWVRRRAHFLERADVVVFVGDTTASAWPETVARLGDLRADLDARQGPPVGLVFQANKRDCADAVPLDEIRARAANARTAVVESSAPDGTGVREAFVFAVRLALDRVRDLHRTGTVRAASGPRVGFGADGVELYEVLRRLDVGADRAGPPPSERAGTRPPSHDAPCGFVWPPIEGRILLRDAAPPPGSPVDVSPVGDCHAAAHSGWIVHSGAASVFVDLDDARAVLIDWARQHAAAQSVLSRRRCIVLAETGDGRWRLWQIVRREASLRQLTAVAPALAERMLGEASAACAQAAPSLPVTLDTIGAELERPVYVGLMPAPVGRGERR
jgi:signal recognition particle receptor subunit beta